MAHQTSGLAAKRGEIVYGMSLGDTVKAEAIEDDDGSIDGMQESSIARAVPLNAKVRVSTTFLIDNNDNFSPGLLHGGRNQVLSHFGT